MALNLKGRSFLTLMDFAPEEIRYMLDLAKDLKAYAAKSSKARMCACCLKRHPPGPAAPLRLPAIRRGPM